MFAHPKLQLSGWQQRRQLLAMLSIILAACLLHTSTARVPALPRLPAEFEHVRLLVLAWPVGMPMLYPLYTEILQASVAEVPVVLIVPTEHVALQVREILAVQDKSVLQRVHFIVAPTRSIWIRDYGPIYVLGNGASPTAIDSRYSPLRVANADLEDQIPAFIAAFTQSATKKIPLVLDGGNLISDGKARCFTSTVLLTQNPDYSLGQITNELRSTFGCRKIEILPAISGEPTGHTGLLIKVLPTNTVLVGKCTVPNDASCAILDSISERLADIEVESGSHYTVRRVPYPMVGLTETAKAYASYINSVILNRTVLVPQFGLPYDKAVLELYQDALPDYRIVPINTQPLRTLGGAVQCISVTVPGVNLDSRVRNP
jgi:agmatine deiminase